MSEFFGDNTESSSQSFVPRPKDWGEMTVKDNGKDSVVFVGQDGRSLQVDGTSLRRPIVTYTAVNTPPYIAQGNLLNADVRNKWAKEIAGPSQDLQTGIAADLNQAATTWYSRKSSTPNTTKSPSAADIAEDAYARLSERGVFYRSNESQGTFWLNKQGSRLHPINSNAVRDLLFEMFDLTPAENKTRYVISGLESLARTQADRVDVHKVATVQDEALYVYANDGWIWCVDIGKERPRRHINGGDGVLFLHNEGLPPLMPALHWRPGEMDRLFEKVLRSQTLPGFDAKAQRRLLKCYTVAALVLPKNVTHPIPAFIGDSGTGKTEGGALTLLQLVYGVRNLELVTAADTQKDIETTLTQAPYACLDNVDGPVPGWMLNVIAAAASRAATSRRKLYTDSVLSQEIMSCNLMLTSRDPRFGREDMAQRILPFFLRPFDARGGEQRIDDQTLERIVSEARSAVWSELFWLAGKVLPVLRAGTDIKTSLRLADFAKVIHGVAEVEGWSKDVPALLQGLQTAQLRLLGCLDSVVAALVEFADQRHEPFVGLRASELLRELRKICPHLEPISAVKLASRLKEQQGALRWAGIDVEWTFDAHIQAARYTVSGRNAEKELL